MVKSQNHLSDLVEAVVLSGAEYLLDVAVRWGGEGRGGGRVLAPELVTGEVGGVQVAGVGPCPGQRVGLELLQQLLLVLPADLVTAAELLHHADALLQDLPPALLLLPPRLPLLLGSLGAVPLEQIGQRVLQNAVARLFTLGAVLGCQTSPLWGLGRLDVFQNVRSFLGVEGEYSFAVGFVSGNRFVSTIN